MWKVLAVLAALVAFAVAAPTAAPQAAAPNENASCIAHFMEMFGPPGSGRSQVHGPLDFPLGQFVRHYAVVHEGGSAEECLQEQD